MTLRITNKCTMGCLHCMENSTPKGESMSLATLHKTLDFIELSNETKVVNISGGEPTLHPEFTEVMSIVMTRLSKRMDVFLLSNGSFLAKPELKKHIFSLLVKYPNLRLQITSVKGLYSKYDMIKKLYYDTKNDTSLPKGYRKVLKRIAFVTKLEYGVLEVGRAAVNKDRISEVTMYRDNKYVSKCFNMYSALKTGWNLMNAIDYVKRESNSSLCVPLIRENGDVVFGEYDACSVVVNLNDTNVTTDTIIKNPEGPCGHCIKEEKSVALMENILGQDYPNMLKDLKLRGES